VSVSGERGTRSEFLRDYQRHVARRRRLGAACAVGLLVLAGVSVSTGVIDIPVRQVLATLLEGGGTRVSAVIWSIRLPRVLGAAVAGAGLAVAGAAMQSVLRNPLGSPFTLGISHAAAFGAAFAIIVLDAGTLGSTPADEVVLRSFHIVTVSAFLWSLLATFAVLLIAGLRGATPESMVLAGVALGSLFTAGTAAMQYFADDVELAAFVFWTFGDIGRVTWNDLGLMAAVTLPAAAYLTANRWKYSALDAGEETAKSLGVDVRRVRTWGMVASSLTTAVIVSLVGIIGFVGLVVPHMVRKVSGGEQRFLVPLSALVGATLLLASDTAARTLFAPLVLPVGILTSFLGAPLFIYLVARGREFW